MGQWVITVAGVAILSVLCDVILPEGHTRKYVKTVFGIVVTLVIVQPLIGLFSGQGSWFTNSFDNSDQLQQQYIESVNNRQKKNATDYVKLLLEYKDLKVTSINVSSYERTVTIQMDETYSEQNEQTVKAAVSVYFPDYEIISIWK